MLPIVSMYFESHSPWKGYFLQAWFSWLLLIMLLLLAHAVLSRTSIWPSFCWRAGSSSSGVAFCCRNSYGCGEAVSPAKYHIPAGSTQGISSSTSTWTGLSCMFVPHHSLIGVGIWSWCGRTMLWTTWQSILHRGLEEYPLATKWAFNLSTEVRLKKKKAINWSIKVTSLYKLTHKQQQTYRQGGAQVLKHCFVAKASISSSIAALWCRRESHLGALLNCHEIFILNSLCACSTLLFPYDNEDTQSYVSLGPPMVPLNKTRLLTADHNCHFHNSDLCICDKESKFMLSIVKFHWLHDLSQVFYSMYGNFFFTENRHDIDYF